MSTLQIDLDQHTADALALLAAARGTAPADLVADIVARYVRVRERSDPRPDGPSSQEAVPDARLVGVRIESLMDVIGAEPTDRGPARPDPLDAIVGSIHSEPVDDIDEVIYGR